MMGISAKDKISINNTQYIVSSHIVSLSKIYIENNAFTNKNPNTGIVDPYKIAKNAPK